MENLFMKMLDRLTEVYNGSNIHKFIFWMVAIFFLIPLFTYMISLPLVFLVWLVALPFGGWTEENTDIAFWILIGASLLLSILAVIRLSRPFRNQKVKS
jgi:ABC-type dipeptide/oligopeptide/nickel transport system permease component